MHVHLVEVMSLKIDLNRVPDICILDASDITYLSKAPRERVIGQLQAGQRTLIGAKEYNVHVHL